MILHAAALYYLIILTKYDTKVLQFGARRSAGFGSSPEPVYTARIQLYIVCCFIVACGGILLKYYHDRQNIVCATYICFELCAVYGANSDIQVSRQ